MEARDVLVAFCRFFAKIALPESVQLELIPPSPLANNYTSSLFSLDKLLEVNTSFISVARLGHRRDGGCSTLCIIGEDGLCYPLSNDASRIRHIASLPSQTFEVRIRISRSSTLASPHKLRFITPPRSMSSFILECRFLPYRSTHTTALDRIG